MYKYVIVLLYVFLFFTGCYESGLRGSGIVSSEERSIPAFNEIKIGGAYKANVIFSDEYKIKITCEDNILNQVRTEVRGNSLIIDNAQSLRTNSDIILNIYTKSLNRLYISGAATVNISNMNEESFVSETSGAGKLNLSGKVNDLSISSSGAAKVDAKNLKAYNANITISGAGSVDLKVENKLDATVSGAGSVNYYGEPKSVKRKVSGIGSVKKRD